MEKHNQNLIQIVSRKNGEDGNGNNLIQLQNGFPDTLEFWKNAYFEFEVTTSENSQKVQKRDIALLIEFIKEHESNISREAWTPRLSKAFAEYLKNFVIESGKRRFNDKTINRIIAHNKTFAKWINKLRSFPLGNPMEKLKLLPIGTGLEIERAFTPQERGKILDTADFLLITGGLSKDRNRYKNKGFERLGSSQGRHAPKRKNYRPYRNRAIVYTLIETGMRRGAVVNIKINDIDFKHCIIRTEEKGGLQHSYHISKEGLQAISDYIKEERTQDTEINKSVSLFLSAPHIAHSKNQLSVRMINNIWNEICGMAGIKGKTPHSARHAMGKHIISKTGNISAVQRQLGHKNASYSMQYSRITAEEMRKVVDER